MTSFSIPELFEQEINEGVDIFAGGRMDVDYNEPSEREKDIVRKIFKARVKQIGRVSQKVADTLTPQMEVFVKFAGIAKAMFPENKQIRYPSEAGSIGCDFINIPYFVRYNTTHTAVPTDYTTNWQLKSRARIEQILDDDTWGADPVVVPSVDDDDHYGNVTLNDASDYLAGETAYILGGSGITADSDEYPWSTIIADGDDAGTTYRLVDDDDGTRASRFARGTWYKASSTNEARSLMVFAQDGFLEVGSTPILNQFQITTEVQSKYAPYNISPINEMLPVEDHKNLHQMSTMGVLPVYHNLGTKLTAKVDAAGSPTLVPLGMIFYEHNFYTTPQYLTDAAITGAIEKVVG